MLTLIELDKLLRLNEQLQIIELRNKTNTSLKRLLELQLHRQLVKDCIIDRLSTIVELKAVTVTKLDEVA
jgi:hypothetical protein